MPAPAETPPLRSLAELAAAWRARHVATRPETPLEGDAAPETEERP